MYGALHVVCAWDEYSSRVRCGACNTVSANSTYTYALPCKLSTGHVECAWEYDRNVLCLWLAARRLAGLAPSKG